MTDLQIAWLELALVGGGGALLLIAGMLIKISGPPLPIKSDAYEDEKCGLHVKTGPAANIRVLTEKLWPSDAVIN